MGKNALACTLALLFAGSMISCIASVAEEDEPAADDDYGVHGYNSLGGYIDGVYIDNLSADRAAECVRRWFKAEFGRDPEGIHMPTPAHIRARYQCPSHPSQ